MRELQRGVMANPNQGTQLKFCSSKFTESLHSVCSNTNWREYIYNKIKNSPNEVSMMKIYEYLAWRKG